MWRALTGHDNDCPADLLADFRLYQASQKLRTQPWNMGVRTPVGGDYWINRVFLFEKVAAKVEEHHEQVRRAAQGGGQ